MTPDNITVTIDIDGAKVAALQTEIDRLRARLEAMHVLYTGALAAQVDLLQQNGIAPMMMIRFDDLPRYTRNAIASENRAAECLAQICACVQGLQPRTVRSLYRTLDELERCYRRLLAGDGDLWRQLQRLVEVDAGD